MIDSSTPITPGNWVPLAHCGAFTEQVGGLFILALDRPEEPVRIGLEIAAHHCNPGGNCHGGMLATLIDIALGRNVAIATRSENATLTMSLSLSFLKPGRQGNWIESRTQILQSGKRTTFATGEFIDRSGRIIHGTASFRTLTRPPAADTPSNSKDA